MRIIFKISDAELGLLVVSLSLLNRIGTKTFNLFQILYLQSSTLYLIWWYDWYADNSFSNMFFHSNSHSGTVTHSFIQHAEQGQWVH